MSGGAFCFRLKNILKIVAQKLAQLQKTLYLCVIKVTNQSQLKYFSNEKRNHLQEQNHY